MTEDLKQYFEDFDFNGESDCNIRSVNDVLLPEDYLIFMKEYNGGEGGIGEDGYIVLYRLEQLQQINCDYQVEKYLPNHCLIGSDGGGEAFGVDEEGNFFAVPFVPMDKKEKIILGSTFSDFIKNAGVY